MDNKRIQRKILKLLFKFRLENKQALSDVIIEKLSITVTEYGFNMDYLIEKELVNSHNFSNGLFTDTEYVITAKGVDMVEAGFIKIKKSTETNVNQFFYAGNVAGRDFTINNITANIYLQALELAIEKSDDIPNNQKKDLIQKIREIKDNPLVVGLSVVAISEAMKHLLTPS